MLGNKIYIELKKKGLTQSELAERVGVSNNSMSLYIHKGKMPKASVLAKIASALDTTADYLLQEGPDDNESLPENLRTSSVLGARIRRELDRQGLKQFELAKRSGLSSSSISMYIHKGKIPKASSLLKIADALGTTPEYLLGIDPDEYNPPEKEKICERVLEKMKFLTKEPVPAFTLTKEPDACPPNKYMPGNFAYDFSEDEAER